MRALVTEPGGNASVHPELGSTQAVHAQRLERLLQPEHAAQFETLVRTLPPTSLLELYRSFFGRSKEGMAQGQLLAKSALKRLTLEHIVAALPRAREKKPKLLQTIGKFWLDLHTPALDRLAQDDLPGQSFGSEALSLMLWVLGEDSASPQALLHRALNRVAQLERTVQQLEHTQLEQERQLLEMRQAGEQAEQERLRREQVHTQTVRETRDDSVRFAQQHAQALAQVQGEHQALNHEHRHQLEQHERLIQEYRAEQEARQTLEQLLEQCSNQLDSERQQADRERQAQAEERSTLHESYQHQLATLRLELDGAQRQRPSLPLSEAALEQVLILDYQQLGPDPASRLIGLFQAYKAFLKGQSQEVHLAQASNIAQVQGQPKGVVLLGVERMLEDGSQLPLERMLTSRLMNQESLLHQLIERTTSPRLSPPTRPPTPTLPPQLPPAWMPAQEKDLPAGLSTDAYLAQLTRHLNRLQTRMQRPNFWTGHFAEIFSESLAALDSAQQPLEVETDFEVQEVFNAWHTEIETTLADFERSGFEVVRAEHLRRLLLCQWVYLRWRELTAFELERA